MHNSVSHNFDSVLWLTVHMLEYKEICDKDKTAL